MSLTIMEGLKERLIKKGVSKEDIKTNNIAALIDQLSGTEKASLNIAQAVDALNASEETEETEETNPET